MILSRTDYRDDGIFGTLMDEDGDHLAVTLEPNYHGLAKLPLGTYQCVRGMHTIMSHPLPFETFEVTGVPGHTGILFHWGNWQRDSNGCILVGLTTADSEKGQMITESLHTFDRFMGELDGRDAFILKVEDANPRVWI